MPQGMESEMLIKVVSYQIRKIRAYSFRINIRDIWIRYISSCLSNVSAIDKSILFITYVGLTKKELDFVREQVERRVHFDNIYVQKASPTIAVNSGPGTFGLLYKRRK